MRGIDVTSATCDFTNAPSARPVALNTSWVRNTNGHGAARL